jgi:hypothetical protein
VLFVALGGTGYAAIANDTSQDTKLFTSLFNSRISNAHVAFATRAGTADNAATVGHNTIRNVAVAVHIPASGSTPTTLFKLNGHTVPHVCLSGLGDQELAASTSTVGELKLVTVDEDTPGLHEYGVDKFDFKPSDGTVNLYSGIYDSENVVGHLIWQTQSGKVLTFEYQDETNLFGGSNCILGGMVIAG